MRKRTFLLIAATTGALALGAQAAVAAAAPDSQPTYTGCLRTTGDQPGRINAVKQGPAPLRACSADETQIALSGGDITAIAAGVGLRATSATNGIVDAEGSATLDLAPNYRLPQNCKSGDIVMSTPTDGWACALPPKAAAVPNAIIQGVDKGPAIIGDDWANLGGKLDLPAGSWAIVAKVMIGTDNIDDAFELWANCRLDAGGATWLDRAFLSSLEPRDDIELTLTGAVTTANASTAAIACMDSGTDARWSDVTITAIQGSSVTRVNF